MKPLIPIPNAAPRLRAFRQERGQDARFEVQAAAGETEAALYIYGDVFDNGGDSWWGGLDVNAIVREIDRLTVETLHVHINSRGGDVFDGLAIYNALARQSYTVVVHVDGLAASIASVIAMAGDDIRMAKGAFMMIHLASVCGCGNAPEMREMAAILDKIDAALAGIYASRSGMRDKDALAAMGAETWYGATEAIKVGLADGEDVGKVAAKAAGDLRVYAHTPEPLRAAPEHPNGATTARRATISTARDFEAFLRDEGGFSRRAAKAIAAGGFRAQPDARDEHGHQPQRETAVPEGAAALSESVTRLSAFLAQRTGS